MSKPPATGPIYASAFQSGEGWFISIYAPAGIWVRTLNRYPDQQTAIKACESYGFRLWKQPKDADPHHRNPPVRQTAEAGARKAVEIKNAKVTKQVT